MDKEPAGVDAQTRAVAAAVAATAAAAAAAAAGCSCRGCCSPRGNLVAAAAEGSMGGRTGGRTPNPSDS